MQGKSYCIILVAVNHTAACFNNWSSVCVCHEVLTPVALVNAGLSRTVQTQASEGNVTATMKRAVEKTCNIA
jgi:hypothetical protein